MTLSKSYKPTSENSKLTLQQWLDKSIKKLSSVGIATARLDALVLLSDALGKHKAWLLAHLDSDLSQTLAKKLNYQVSRRAKREPIAYIRGRQEFYGRDFVVNKNVLIPRPDSEVLIDLLKPLVKNTPGMLIDVGTGSGALGITAALECPNLDVELIDINPEALAIAKRNARRFKLKLQFSVADLLASHIRQPDHPYIQFIIANLPYVDKQWEVSPEIQFEPNLAIFADGNGLILIKRLIDQTQLALVTGGHLLLEADPRQHNGIIKFAKTHSLDLVNQQDFALVFKKD